METAPSPLDSAPATPDITTDSPEASSEFVEPEYERIDLRKEGDELGRELAKLTDPATALRFREGLSQRLHDQGIRLPSRTRGLFRTWGIDGPRSPDQHAVASFLGVSDEEWAAQTNSLDPRADGVEFVPVEYVKAFDSLVRRDDSDLLSEIKNQHAHKSDEKYKEVLNEALTPMKVVTEHDRYMSMPTEQLDQAIRTSGDPYEQSRLINTYMLPRVDEQERWLRTDEAKADEDESNTARAIIADIEARLRDIGIQRMEAVGTKYDPRSHAIVKTTGSGPYWIVAEQLRAGYKVDKSTLRPATVNVIRMTQTEFDNYNEARAEQKAAEKKRTDKARRTRATAGRAALKGQEASPTPLEDTPAPSAETPVTEPEPAEPLPDSSDDTKPAESMPAEPADTQESIKDIMSDDLTRQAADLVVATNFGSTSMLQRKLRVRYNEAQDLMARLERAGVVRRRENTSDTSSRDVVMNREELDKLLAGDNEK